MTKTSQAKYSKLVIANWPRVQVQLLQSDGSRVDKWKALVAKHGGQKPALLALLDGVKE
jgi:hypothetical protein